MIQLFVYGTLRDAEYQQALFDHVVPTRPATLAGWLVVVAESGYLTLIAAPGEVAAGDLIALDDAELALADAWEEPAYERLPVEARDAGGRAVAALAYVRPTASRERPAAGALARHAREQVLEQIHALRRQVRTKSESA